MSIKENLEKQAAILRHQTDTLLKIIKVLRESPAVSDTIWLDDHETVCEALIRVAKELGADEMDIDEVTES